MSHTQTIKWPEIFSLGFLSVSIAISWIAYHEYQPRLLHDFNLTDMALFLVWVKAIVLVLTPPLAGWLADWLLKKNGKFFILFSVGIGAAAMVFMVVASIIGAGPLGTLKPVLPVMIVLWLISMNTFVSPAYSMIDAFAPKDRLPVVVGFLFLTTELIYALEPMVIHLVEFFGATLTFVVGGVLIAGSGILFQKVAQNEVMAKRAMSLDSTTTTTISKFIPIVVFGLALGLAKAVLVEYIPEVIQFEKLSGRVFSLLLLAAAAILGFALSQLLKRFDYDRMFMLSGILTSIGIVALMFTTSTSLWLVGGVTTAAAFALLNISGLPFALSNLSAKHITLGVGAFIGASEIIAGIFEVLLF